MPFATWPKHLFLGWIIQRAEAACVTFFWLMSGVCLTAPGTMLQFLGPHPEGKPFFFFLPCFLFHAWIRIAVYHCFSKLVLAIWIHSNADIRSPAACFLYGLWQCFPKSLWRCDYALTIGTLCLLILVPLVTHWSPATQSKLCCNLVARSLLKALSRGISSLIKHSCQSLFFLWDCLLMHL